MNNFEGAAVAPVSAEAKRSVINPLIFVALVIASGALRNLVRRN